MYYLRLPVSGCSGLMLATSAEAYPGPSLFRPNQQVAPYIVMTCKQPPLLILPLPLVQRTGCTLHKSCRRYSIYAATSRRVHLIAPIEGWVGRVQNRLYVGDVVYATSRFCQSQTSLETNSMRAVIHPKDVIIKIIK